MKKLFYAAALFCLYADNIRAEKAMEATPLFHKILVIGDSITFHEAKESIGWNGNRGMAASADDKDYVHLFYKMLNDFQGKSNPELHYGKGGNLIAHLKAVKRYRDTGADLVIVQLGENEKADELDEKRFKEPYRKLVRSIRSEGNPLVLCLGVWRHSVLADKCNKMIQEVCEETGSYYVSVKHIREKYAQTSAEGKYENKAVASHPGDMGHKMYAEAIFEKLKEVRGKPRLPLTPDEPANGSRLFDNKFNEYAGDDWKAGISQMNNVGKKVITIDDWKVGISQMNNVGKKVITIGDGKWEAVRLKIKIKPMEFSKQHYDHFVGIKARGVFITLRENSIGCAVDGVGGAERTLIEKASIQGHWNEFEICYMPDKISVEFANEKATILNPLFYKGGIDIMTWNQSAEFTDVYVDKMNVRRDLIESQKNLLKNGSFELQTAKGIPDGWTDGLGWGLHAPQWTSEEGYKQYFESWGIDDKEFLSGKHSMRIKYPISLVSIFRPLDHNEPYVFSAYIKADEENIPVRFILKCFSNGKIIVVSEKEMHVKKTFSRYHFTMDSLPQARAFCVEIKPEKENSILWIDNAQLEEGKQPTSFVENQYTQPADNDFDVKIPPLPPRVPQVFFDKSFYSTECFGTIRCSGFENSAYPLRMNVIVRNPAGDILKSSSKLLQKSSDSFIEIDLKGIPEGNYNADVQISSRKQEISNYTLMLRKQMEQASSVKIDHVNRAIMVRETPRMLFSLVFETAPSRETLLLLKQAGYEFIAICFQNVAKISPVLDEMEKLGMKCIVWLPAGANPAMTKRHTDNIANALTKCKNHPALLAWWIYDEPHLESEPFKELYSYTKKGDFLHPVIINYTTGAVMAEVGGLPGDILCYDNYPIPDRPVQSVFTTSYIADRAAEKYRKPHWIIVQSFGNAFSRYRSPSESELEFMTYSSIMNGATGILFYAGLPRGKKQWEKLSALNQEVQSLQNIIFNSSRLSNCCISSSSVKTVAFKNSEFLYLLSLNTKNRSLPNAEITLPDGVNYEASASVEFEDRPIQIMNGKIKDVFNGFQRHVYKIRLR